MVDLALSSEQICRFARPVRQVIRKGGQDGQKLILQYLKTSSQYKSW